MAPPKAVSLLSARQLDLGIDEVSADKSGRDRQGAGDERLPMVDIAAPTEDVVSNRQNDEAGDEENSAYGPPKPRQSRA
jgi:hypothetical protein